MCYALALHRATPYLAGIGLGVLLQQTGKDVTLSKVIYYNNMLMMILFDQSYLFS